MKILHTADIHLKEYNDKRWKTLQTLIETGRSEKIEIFVISGDLFNEDYNAEDLRPKIREIFSSNGFEIIIIPGNHDSDSYNNVFLGHDVHVLDSASPFLYNDVQIWGLPFRQMEGAAVLDILHSLKDKLNADKTNIILYHGELLDAFFSRRDFGNEGQRRYMPVKLSYFKDLNIDYVLAGHFHSNFNIYLLEGGGYFVYPGSPISITRREIGQRKVNLFEVGKPPREYVLDTFHYERMHIELDPLKDENPLDIIKRNLKDVPSCANIILSIGGYINSKKVDIDECELAKQIEEITGENCAEKHLEFRDIHTILEDDLFRRFEEKLQAKEYDKDRKKQIYDMVIKAMMEAKL